MRLANIPIYTVINIHDYREMVDAGVEGVITSLVLFSTLLTPCTDWPLQAFPSSRGSTDTMSSELWKKSDLTQDEVSN